MSQANHYSCRRPPPYPNQFLALQFSKQFAMSFLNSNHTHAAHCKQEYKDANQILRHILLPNPNPMSCESSRQLQHRLRFYFVEKISLSDFLNWLSLSLAL